MTTAARHRHPRFTSLLSSASGCFLVLMIYNGFAPSLTSLGNNTASVQVPSCHHHSNNIQQHITNTTYRVLCDEIVLHQPRIVGQQTLVMLVAPGGFSYPSNLQNGRGLSSPDMAQRIRHWHASPPLHWRTMRHVCRNHPHLRVLDFTTSALYGYLAASLGHEADVISGDVTLHCMGLYVNPGFDKLISLYQESLTQSMADVINQFVLRSATRVWIQVHDCDKVPDGLSNYNDTILGIGCHHGRLRNPSWIQWFASADKWTLVPPRPGVTFDGPTAWTLENLTAVD